MSGWAVERSSRVKLNRQDSIYENLRRVYSETPSDDISDRFSDLIEQIRDTERKRNSTEEGHDDDR